MVALKGNMHKINIWIKINLIKIRKKKKKPSAVNRFVTSSSITA